MYKTNDVLRKFQQETLAHRQKLQTGEIRLPSQPEKEQIAQVRTYFEENFDNVPLNLSVEPADGNLNVHIGSPVRYYIVFTQDFFLDKKEGHAVTDALQSLAGGRLTDYIRHEGEGKTLVISARGVIQMWTAWGT